MNRGDKGNGRATPGRVMTGPRARTATRNGDEASAEHRRKLEALFSGGTAGPAPASTGRVTPVSERVFASPRKSLGRSPSEYRLRLERLRIAREPDEIKEAADAFLLHHQLPDDLDVLLKVLQHPSERVLREAMGQISSLLIQGRVASTIILADRLGDLSARVQEDATRSYIDGLRNQLASIKK